MSSYTVAIYRSADPVTASPVATRDLGKPTPVGGDITVDISTLVNPLPAGTYKAVVRRVGARRHDCQRAVVDVHERKVQGVQEGSKTRFLNRP